MRDFRKLNIWRDGIEIVKIIYGLTEGFPSNEKFGLRSQITRAAVSIPSNIAEGSSRKSKKDFGRFLEIALGSAFELETQLVVARELGWISSKRFIEVNDILNKEQRSIRLMLNRIKEDT